MLPKILVTCGKLNFPEDIGEKLRPLAEIIYVQGDYKKELKEARAIIASSDVVNDKYLEAAPNLGIVARFGVGYDTVDVDACTRHRVWVCHTPDVLSEAVAELTLALIFAWMRHIPEADRYTREEWGKKLRGFPFGWDISGKTLGFLGLGRIGVEVAKRAKGFGVKMIYYDVVRRQEVEAQYGIAFVTFEELLRTSDILSVHVPLIPSTKGILSRKQFEMMKPSALLVNTSRGPVIDQRALTEALKGRRIAGAALDVFEVEPAPLTEEILKLENVVVTPHIASATWETRHRMAERCAESIKAFLEGEKPPFTVPEQNNASF
jgi:glyoxylate reductase